MIIRFVLGIDILVYEAHVYELKSFGQKMAFYWFDSPEKLVWVR